MRGRTAGRLALAGLLLGAAANAMRKAGAEIKPGFNFFSKRQDVQLGQESAAQIRKQTHVVENRDMQDYISRIGRKLTARPEADGASYSYSFTVITDKSINAFALPGGPMFIHTGLITAAENEAQLAGVMGHEISHVALRHGTHQVSKANLIQLPAALASGILGGGGLVGQLAQIGIGLGANSLLLKYSRDAESDADALGARMMSAAGYNPIEMARFFEKLEADGGSRGPQFLSDHPNPGNRVKAVEEEILAMPRRAYAPPQSAEFTRMKTLVAGLPAVERAGFRNAPPSAPGETPSRGARTYRGRTFQIAYPDNWEAFGGDEADSVTIGPRKGLVKAANGSVQVGYGAILSYYFPQDRHSGLGDATNDLVHHLRAADPHIQVASRTQRRVRVGGAAGLVTNLSSASPFGGVETDVLVTVARPGGLFYMIFAAPEREFRNLDAVFNQMLQSIRFQ